MPQKGCRQAQQQVRFSSQGRHCSAVLQEATATLHTASVSRLALPNSQPFLCFTLPT